MESEDSLGGEAVTGYDREGVRNLRITSGNQLISDH